MPSRKKVEDDSEWIPPLDPKEMGREFESKMNDIVYCKICLKKYIPAKCNQSVYDSYHFCSNGKLLKIQYKHTINDMYPDSVVVTKASENGTLQSPIKIIKGKKLNDGSTSVQIFSPGSPSPNSKSYYKKIKKNRWGSPVLQLRSGSIKKIRKINYDAVYYL